MENDITLVIAEKPSVARDIAHVLGCREKGEGYFKGKQYMVSWAIGHLVTLADPEEYDPIYQKWKRETLPILPEKMKLKAVGKTVSQLKLLRKLMNSKEVTSLICATDSGREGELIFRYIYEIVKCKKPFQRLWISSMTDIAIQEGFANLKDGSAYDNLYLSAKCRSEADWLVGINASRAYTLQYHALLSIGRVQTPTLAILVERQKEIDAFVPEVYYEVQVQYETFSGIWFDKQETDTRIKEQEKAKALAEKIKGKTGVITSIEQEEKKQPPPLLYDLTELQRDCNKKFGFSAQKTLNIAQSLYEKRKMITYPRTDSRYLSEDMKGKVKRTLQKLGEIEQYARDTEQVLSKLFFGKRIIDNSKVTDHHAIIPTEKVTSWNTLTEEEKKVYHTIVLRFLAVFFPYYRYMVTKVIVDVIGEHTISKGTTILEEGWAELYHRLDLAKPEKKEEEVLPPLEQGQSVIAKNTKWSQKKTKPPALYTESSLLSAMEHAGRFVEEESLKEQLRENGLGTPATRAAIIERLLTVGYIVRKGKNLVPTEKGMQLIEIVPQELKSPQTTGKWEKGLSSIAKGEMTPERFMGSITRYVQYLIQASDVVNPTVVFPEEARRKKGRQKAKGLGTCPSCQKGRILENTKAFYCTEWKQGCQFTVWKNSLVSYGISLDEKIMKKLLKDGKIEGIPMVLPQTQEKGTGTLLLQKEEVVKLELMNFTRTK